MIPFRTSLAVALTALVWSLASPADAMIQASSASGWGESPVDLVDSRIKITVGDQWVDVEEEAELLVPSEWYDSGDDILVEGTVSLPPHAALVGCLLWNNDTLLMGKLRGRADAQHKFDSLVPRRPVFVPQDPLLLDMQDDSTYGFKLYPFVPGGTRRFRLRYLLPLMSSNEVEIKPLMARMVSGTIPNRFTLQVRGKRTDLKLLTQEGSWPLTLPADRTPSLSLTSGIRLWLGSRRASPDGSHAIRTRIDTGAWQGDFVFYSAKVPDSILIPTTRTVLAATLSMQSGTTEIVRDVVIRKGADGSWRSGFTLHAKSLGSRVRWNFWTEDADTLASFEVTPAWESSVDDSVLPRLWARSEAPISPVFLGKELAPLFGFVDPRYSLLALPSDSLGRVRQAALRDSGLPFLSGREIFRSTGYGSESGNGSGLGAGASSDVAKRSLGLQFVASRRVVAVELSGLGAVRVEIRDLQGRVVARFADVAGRSRIEWDLRSLTGGTVPKGLYVVSVQTGTALLSERVLVH